MSVRTIVYVSCATAQQIVTLTLDPDTGALHEIGRLTVPGATDPAPGSLPLALAPSHRFLYAGLRNPPFPLVSFAIDPATGALAEIGRATLDDSMTYLSVDKTGRALFSASYSGAKLAVNAIAANGVAGPPVQVLATPPKAHSALPDPSNRFVYAACLGGDLVLAQPFDAATGRLAGAVQAGGATAPGAGPRHLAFGQGGAILYVVNELDGSVNTYARNTATGALQLRQSLSLLPAGITGSVAAADIHLTPDGRYLYASERITHTLAGFAVDTADGTLSLVSRAASEPTPRGFAIDPRGRFLLCAGLTSGGLGVYRIVAETGALVRLGSVPVGAGANWVEIFDLPTG